MRPPRSRGVQESATASARLWGEELVLTGDWRFFGAGTKNKSRQSLIVRKNGQGTGVGFDPERLVREKPNLVKRRNLQISVRRFAHGILPNGQRLLVGKRPGDGSGVLLRSANGLQLQRIEADDDLILLGYDLEQGGVFDWLQTADTVVPVKIAIVLVSKPALIKAFMRVVLA